MTEQRARELLAATGWTRLQTDYLPDDCDGQEEGWRIHDFPPNSHVAHWICGGLEEAEAKAFVALVNAALSTPFAESAKKSPSDSVRAALGPASDWDTKIAELYNWTGSKFLSGEKQSKAAAASDRSQLYGWLCGLGGYLMAARAALQSSEADNG